MAISRRVTSEWSSIPVGSSSRATGYRSSRRIAGLRGVRFLKLPLTRPVTANRVNAINEALATSIARAPSMANSGIPRVDLKLRLGLLDIGISNLSLPWRWRRAARRGPYLIVDRFKGLALDSNHRYAPGSEPIMWPPNGGVQQRWQVDRVHGTREYTITSVETGLRLDAGEQFDLSRHPMMSPPRDVAHQRWGFVPSPETVGCLIVSSHSTHVLDFPQQADRGEPPHLYARHNGLHQQFLLLLAASVS